MLPIEGRHVPRHNGYRAKAVSEVGAVAAHAEQRKRQELFKKSHGVVIFKTSDPG